MRLLRLTLRNWRGIEERTVEFGASGVTVVEGPNEVGKSCLVEAVDLLFDELDSTKKREVLAVKPVHRDEGAEVELELESGPYALTYFKRFHKRSETRLTVLRPRPESLTGREAHERVRQILGETIDTVLWRALRIAQGAELALPRLDGETRLSAALDRAAGGGAAGEREESLFEAVRAEHDLYFTSRGERKETAERRAAAAALREEEERLRADLRRVESDVETVAALRRKAREGQTRLGELAETARRREQREREVALLRGEVATRDAQLETARAEEREARAVAEERRRAEAEAARLADEALRRLAESEQSAPAHAAAKGEADAAREELAAARRAAEAARTALQLREADFEHCRAGLDLQQLGERLSRVEEAEARAAAAEEELARNPVDAARLGLLREAHLALELARARLEAGGPALRVEAERDLDLVWGGEPRRLAAGAALDLKGAAGLELRLPGTLRLKVAAGSGTADLEHARDEARRRFDELCAAAGVSGVEAAAARHEARREAERALAARDRVLKADLRDLSRAQIERKIASLGPRVAAYPAERPADPPLPEGFDAAQSLREQAAAAAAAAETVLDRAAARSEEAAARVRALEERATESRVHCEVAQQTARDAAAALERAREALPVERIAAVLAAAEERVRKLAAEAEGARERLAAESPDEVEALARNAREALADAERELGALERERIALEAVLRERGEAGLAERVAAAEAARVRAEAELASHLQRAAAAKLLHDTLVAERDAARRGYVAPLRDRIEKLGRLVFGDGFSVELSEDLRITSRTLGGRTVPFESLSGGAREQLGILGRVACALTVNDDGGVPVVLDDALGYTDPERLEGMGALLALAGRQCQVIVLTCVPDRYRHVGGAHVVRLRA